jgi:cytochrome c-type biogenesis protein CcmH/NrfF
MIPILASCTISLKSAVHPGQKLTGPKEEEEESLLTKQLQPYVCSNFLASFQA